MRKRLNNNRRAASALLVSAAVVVTVFVTGPGASADTIVSPTVTAQPGIAVVGAAGDSTSFSAAANGSPAPTVKWQEASDRRGPWTSIAGATDPTLSITASTANLGHAYRAVFTNAGGTAVSRPAKLVSTENWMRDLGSDIEKVPLTELTIPGSHDTGTYGASGDGETSKDHQAEVCETIISSDSICQSYAKAQNRGITDELNDGIRYFDLRICGSGDLPSSPEPPDFVAISANPVTCHELVAAPLGQILFQAADWAGKHPDEVIFLDFNHLYQVDPDTVATQVENAFDIGGGHSLLIPPQYCNGDYNAGTCAGDLTLKKIREQGLGNVIVNFENDGVPGQERCFPSDDDPTYHPGCTPQYRAQHGLLPSFWLIHYNLWGLTSSLTEMFMCTVGGAEASCFGNDSDVGTVRGRVLDTLANRQTFAEPHPAYQFQHFFVQFLQTTPDGGYIAGHITGSLLDMAMSSNPVIGPAVFGCGGEWNVTDCFGQYRPENLNILAINFYNYTDYLVGFLNPTPVHFDFVREVLSFDAYARTAPVVRISSPAQPASTSWYNAASLGGQGNKLEVDVSAEDYRYPTGIAALDCLDFAASGQLANVQDTASTRSGNLSLGDGVHSIDCRASDGASLGTHETGNRGAGPGSTQLPVTFSVDTTPPVIHCPANTQLLLNQPLSTMTGTVTDAASGPAGSAATAPISTSSVGSFTATLTGSNVAGNTATAVCSYTVSYRIALKYDTTKQWNSGTTVPIKVELDDYYGKDVSDKSIVVTATAVTNTGTGATLVPTSPGTTNQNLVFFVSPTKGYQYNLKTVGYSTGSYTLDFVAGLDPLSHHAPFVIR